VKDVYCCGVYNTRLAAFHFVEDPELPEVFDSRLHPGISTSKNAIKLLAKWGSLRPLFERHAVLRMSLQHHNRGWCLKRLSLNPSG
jgi:hypothetical protein